ncbi:hypothetical protein [Halobacillus campisalis]|uniref:Uncharacterized protein n=1 Tax=Halobacillus campisalis TaxID=435909 RepID=A0ABW2K723_9BACI|nr:hypothetical protein [Halobacillus campisalis]
MIERLPTLKKWKRYGKGQKRSVNVIRILSGELLPQADTAKEDREANEDKDRATKVDIEPSKSKHIQEHVLDTTDALKHAIPNKLYEVMSPFFNGEGLYETIGALYRAKATIDPTIQAEDHPEYVEAFLSCIRRYKEGKVRNLQSYLYSAWNKVSRGIYLRRMADVY